MITQFEIKPRKIFLVQLDSTEMFLLQSAISDMTYTLSHHKDYESDPIYIQIVKLSKKLSDLEYEANKDLPHESI